MASFLLRPVRAALAARGYRITRTQPGGWPLDFRPADIALVSRVQPYTMTSPERIMAMAAATRHVATHQVPGAILECGVWKGGSMMAAALTLLEQGLHDRELVLCDVFDAPMPNPSAQDGTVTGDRPQAGGKPYWAAVTLAEVQKALASTGYPDASIRYVQGRVEDTLPAAAPEQISVLRLDTDWYASTMHELRTLYPRLTPKGVLIVDDYGSHHGVRRAVDAYFADVIPPLLVRVDLGAVMGVKL